MEKFCQKRLWLKSIKIISECTLEDLVKNPNILEEAVDIPKPHLNPKVKLTESSSNKGQSYESSVSSSTSNRVSEVLFKF